MRTFLLGAFFLFIAACGSANRCITDSDCRLVSDYCSCSCRGAATSEPDPKCATPACVTVQDICFGRSVQCRSGLCSTR